MKILVTGSSGFIGQYLTLELQARGHQVVPFDRPHDVTDRKALFNAALPAAQAIINLAGMLGTPELFGSEREAAEVNILGAVNCYDVARRLEIPVVQIGTGHKGQPNPYAITKACAEDLGLARAQWLGEKIAVVRAFHVYGEGQLPGSPYGPAKVQKFFPTFACRALSGLPLEVHGGGNQLIDPVHAADVAAVLADAVAGPYGVVIEAGTGKSVSVRQVAQDIAVAAGEYGLPVVTVGQRAGEPLDADVVAGAPACSSQWPHMIRETTDWYRQWLDRSSPS